MKLFPFESFVIGSPRTPPELTALLRQRIEPPKVFAIVRPRTEFVGVVGEHGFRIKRVLSWRASFVPEISGKFTAGAAGTRIDVEITPSDGVLTIVAVLCGSLVLLVFQRGTHVFLAIAGIVILAWLFSMLGFWLDAGVSSRRLTQLLAEHSPTLDKV
jgi:hypothetical protein